MCLQLIHTVVWQTEVNTIIKNKLKKKYKEPAHLDNKCGYEYMLSSGNVWM